MKAIVAQNQIDLGLGRCFQLAVSGILFRLFRSLVTLSILALAVAFLAHMLVYGFLSSASERSIGASLEERRELARQVRHLESVDGVVRVLGNLREGEGPALREYARWSGMDEAELERAKERAALLVTLEEALDSLSPRQRAILAGDRSLPQLLDYLEGSAVARERFRERLGQLETGFPADAEAALRRLSEGDWAALKDSVRRIREGQRLAVERLAAGAGEAGLQRLLAEDPGRAEALARAAGYATEAYDFEELRTFVRRVVETRRIEESLGEVTVRRYLARALGVAPSEVNGPALFEWLARSERNRVAFTGLLNETSALAAPAPQELKRIAEDFLRMRRMQALVPDDLAAGPAAAAGGLDASDRWLVFLAFLVCIVGVANAMLMSVTERFTEIATMKCLGSLDKFVMLLFVIEAALYGLLGGGAGALVGLLLALLRGWIEYGEYLVVGAVAGPLFTAALASLLAGLLLAVLAAIGPALVAARLAPMEAMRID